jgi:hypothetical protein
MTASPGRRHDGVGVQGYRGIANIAVAIERDLTARRDSDHCTDKELTAALTV